MPLFLNPTGGTIRNDRGGAGYFKAPRGDEYHRDIDWTLPGGPGQNVLAPITGSVVRISYPYANLTRYSGLVIKGSYATVQMFYIAPTPGIVGQDVGQGQVIGIAQDISQRYPDCEPHIHFRLIEIDPTILF